MNSDGDPIDAGVAAERLRIVFLEGERAVGELETTLGLRQPGLSQQLGERRNAGFIVARREVRSVSHLLADEDQRRLVQALVYGFGGAAPLVEEWRRTRRTHPPMLGASFASVGNAT